MFQPLGLKGLPAPVECFSLAWEHALGRRPIRAVLADDAVLVRRAFARLLEDNGIEVVGEAGDASELLRCVTAARPDVVITDVRMPPTSTVEGLEAAVQICADHLDVAVVIEPVIASRLPSASLPD